MNEIQIDKTSFTSNKNKSPTANFNILKDEKSKTASHNFTQSKKNRDVHNNLSVNIPDAVKEFSRIKKAVDHAPMVNNSHKIAHLKKEIQKGDYKIDFDKLAEKMLSQEF